MTDFTNILTAGALALALSAAPALAADKVSYGTNWLAEAEHGGFYQAVADGTYEKYGLDVTIVQGGPQASNRALLIAGKIDFYMGGVMSSLDGVKEGLPFVTVASMFQKDPQVLLVHPDAGFETFADLAKADKIFLGKDVLVTTFEWMKKNYEGFKDEQYAPYTYNSAPFIADPKSVQQGYLTSEPFAIKNEAGWEPKAFLFADAGYDPYSTSIETSQKMVDEKPDVVKRFVEASIIGWYHYLYGDNSAGNALIKKDNPDMTDAQLTYSLDKMKEAGILVSGDATTKGIGCMTDARYKEFFDKLVSIGLYDASLDYKKAYTTQFVCQGLGTDLVK